MPSSAQRPQPADVFVSFGITGDLAHKMTFVSLYQLERRKLLTCPIVGVAAESWTDDDLRRRAAESVTAALGEAKPDTDVLDRLCARMTYVGGDFKDPATFAAVAKAIGNASAPVFYLEIPPSLFGPVVEGLAAAGLTKNARVVVEKPFGHDLESAQQLNSQLRALLDEDSALPDRPFPREAFRGRHPAPAVRQHRARARLEPQLHQQRPDHDGREHRRGRPRQLLRPRGVPARRRAEPSDAGARDGCHGASFAW